jgi:hypothetical protein
MVTDHTITYQCYKQIKKDEDEELRRQYERPLQGVCGLFITLRRRN